MTASGPPAETATRYRAYGVELACEFPLAVEPSPATTAPVRTIAARARPRREVESLRSDGGGPVHTAVVAGQTRLVVERGGGGDHLIRYGRHPFHLSADLGVLTCAPPPRADAGWRHALLDWVAYSAAVLAGMQCIHASGVECTAGVVALAAASGAGKSSLAAELVSRGASFFCDDVLALAPDGERVLAHPGPPFALLDGRQGRLAERLGAPCGALGDETWVAAERRAGRPAPVAAVLLLDRRESGPPEPRLRSASFVELRGLAIGIPRPGDTEEERFATLAAVAERAPLLRLEAHPSVPPAALAAAVWARLGEEGAR